MAITTSKKQMIVLGDLVRELREIRGQLGKLLLLIPEESLREYKNAPQIKKAYRNALVSFPPK